jgi:phosphohistidine phosphatase SixA
MKSQLSAVILFIFSVAPAAFAEEAVFLIRHAEQELDIEDPPLTEAGHLRANSWVSILAESNIKTVFTSMKRRTKQTGEIISQALNIPMESIPRKDITRLVNQIQAHNSTDRVLVVTHKRQMPKIFKELGLSDEISERVTFSKSEYGKLFIFVPKGEKDGTVFQLRYE